MKRLVLISFVLVGLLGFFNIVDARSGCCSHHGGVCGCGCCDGSSLSATCAPYYPNCNSVEPVLPVVVNKEPAVVIESPVDAPVVSVVIQDDDSTEVNSVSPQTQANASAAAGVAQNISEIKNDKPTSKVQIDSELGANIEDIKSEPGTPVQVSNIDIDNQVETKTNDKSNLTEQQEDDSGGVIGFLLLVGVIGLIVYKIRKKKNI